ncbi:hypothetical protein BDZ89DRAFT_938054 [Hymenopellis radicata]|nr:hypothetical protein BDZ89DRAFT_938054 [Hymenopellis radicata]
MVDQLINVFLGFKRECRRGVFGRVKHYYGVVEAQNRGSLHLHILVWLEGALSPKQIQERCTIDNEFKTRLFSWLDSIIKYELPKDGPLEDTLSAKDKRSLLSRPPHPDLPNFEELWTTHLARVLAAVSQIHAHNDTCFKKIVRAFSLLTAAERDQLCRFFYPQDLVPETYINEDGRIFFRRLHRFMVGHNPIISGAFQCNTDGKFVGSGSFGMALSVYMTNYTAKSSLDSAIVMSALAAALHALGKEMANADEEQCRSLLLKTLNQMNARRELSGQQVASSILAIPNHFTDLHFVKAYWSSTLSWLTPDIFQPPPAVVDDEDRPAPHLQTRPHPMEMIPPIWNRWI